tara:strand:- start:1462 stop:2166 length:705 start_codon:yes stop_codon:yes gene_type:complete
MHKYKLICIILIFFIYSSSSKAEDLNHNIKILENYLNTIKNMSFIFEQYASNKEKEIGWMQIEKPNKLRIEYQGANDLIIISNAHYLVLYKAKDDIITSLSNDGPWSILTKSNLKFSLDKNHSNADGIINNTKIMQINGITHIFYEILMRNKDKKLLPPLILHTSTKPFKINGWTVFNEDNQGTQIKIVKELAFNESIINENTFKLTEKDRDEGNVWLSPFNKTKIVRMNKYRD